MSETLNPIPLACSMLFSCLVYQSLLLLYRVFISLVSISLAIAPALSLFLSPCPLPFPIALPCCHLLSCIRLDHSLLLVSRQSSKESREGRASFLRRCLSQRRLLTRTMTTTLRSVPSLTSSILLLLRSPSSLLFTLSIPPIPQGHASN